MLLLGLTSRRLKLKLPFHAIEGIRLVGPSVRCFIHKERNGGEVSLPHAYTILCHGRLV